MSRKARLQSSTGIYHVLIRSIADLDLFTDQEDRDYYIQILRDLELRGYCKLYAYALFTSHVHLLIRDTASSQSSPVCGESCNQSSPFEGDKRGSEPIGSIMKRLASAYSYFFNVKYDHYGPIYLDRFKSNPVETRDYYLKVLDHIASQPTEAKDICTHTIPSGLLSEEKIANSQIRDKQQASLLDYRERSKRLTDSRLLAFLQQNFAFTNIGEFLQRPDEDIKATIKAAKEVGGSIRQIVRLTGTPYQSVFNVRV